MLWESLYIKLFVIWNMKNNKNYLKQEDYDRMISLMVRVASDFLIMKEGKILLTKRLIHPYKGFWHLPGGMIRKGETLDQAAERILMSEVGLKPISKEFLGYVEYMKLENPEKNITSHDIALCFKTELESGSMKGSFQSDEMDFFTYHQIPDQTIPEVKDFIHKYWEKLIS